MASPRRGTCGLGATLAALVATLCCFCPATAEEADVLGGPIAIEQQSDPQPSSLGRAIGGVMSRLFGGGDRDEAVDDQLSPLLGLPAPDFELPTPTGETLALKDLRGKVVVLDFWATWCGPCMAAMPKLQALHEAQQDNGVIIIGVNQGDDADAVIETLKDKGLTFRQVMDDDQEVGSAYRAAAIPQTVVIGPNGVVQAVHVGFDANLTETLAEQVATVKAGKNLFDPEQIAEAKRRREERVAKLREVFEPIGARQVVTVAEVPVAGGAYFYDSSAKKHFRMPGDQQPKLAIDSGDNQVLVLSLAGDKTRATAIKVFRDSPLDLWDFAPMPTVEGLRLAALGYRYNDDYDMEQLTVAVFNDDGKAAWQAELPIAGEYDPDPAVAVADLNGDGQLEVAVLTEYYDLPTGLAPGDETRVLSVWDLQGKQLVRSWIAGDGGVGLYATPAGGLVVCTGDGVRIVKLKSP
ncbi:MAG: redoxin domain-containing protein [Planctomycetota bacterium]